MTTPIAPDVPSLDTFGAPFGDADGVVDPETEMAAAQMNALITQVVATGHTADKAWAYCTLSGTTLTLADHSAVWGATEAVKPTTTRNGTGDYTVEWAASYDDLQDPALAESHATNLRAALVSGYKSGSARIINVRLVSAVRVDVFAYDAAGSAAELDAFTVTVK